MIFKYFEFLNERIKYTDDFILIKMKNLFFLYDDKKNRPLGYISFNLLENNYFNYYFKENQNLYQKLKLIFLTL